MSVNPRSMANLLRGGRNGVAPKLNVIRDGYERVAERIILRQRREKMRLLVYVLPSGAVYLSPMHKPREDETTLIGAYDMAASVELVADELCHWLNKGR